jgi:hypothetical protein
MEIKKFDFDGIIAAIGGFSALIKKFADMLKEFVASWRKVPAASRDDYEYTEGDA